MKEADHMIVTHNITIDFTKPRKEPHKLDMVQGDTCTRAIAIALTANDAAFTVPDGSAAVVRYRKMDGTGGVYDTMPDGIKAWSIDGNTVTVLMAPQVLTCHGTVWVSVALTYGSQVLGTFTFTLFVHEDPAAGTTESEDYFSYDTIGEINTAIAAALAGVDGIDSRIATALADLTQIEAYFAKSTDDCTDTSKVYVLPDGYIYAYLPVSSNVLDDVGYTENLRLSASGGYTESSYSGADLTGYITVAAGDVIRLKEVTMPDSDSYANKVYFFDNNKTGVNSVSMLSTDVKHSVVFDDDGNVIQFTVIEQTLGGAAGYIRINAANIDEYSVITVNEESTATTIEHVWTSTGHAFVPADYEDRILTLEESSAEAEETLKSLKSRVTALESTETDVLPDYWKRHCDEKAASIRTAMESAGRNKSAFLWYTDVHWAYGSQMAPKLLKYLVSQTAMNKTNFGGDLVDDYAVSADECMDGLRQWRLAVRNIPNHHSVIGNHDDDISELSTVKQRYGFLMAAEEDPNVVRGGDFYYYIDDPCEKTRYLYLDTSMCVTLAAAGNADAAAFAAEALASTPSGWHIAAISHIWFLYADTATPTVGSVPDYCQMYLDLFDDYNARSSGSMAVNGTTVAYDFTAAGGRVEFCIGGHTHVDYDFRSDGGIPVILTETDSRHLRGDLGYAAGTITENSVSGIIADYDAGAVTVVRIGRGSDRIIDL